MDLPGFTAEAALMQRRISQGAGTVLLDGRTASVIPAWPGDSARFPNWRTDIQLNSCLRDCDRFYDACLRNCSDPVCHFYCSLDHSQCYTWGCLWPEQ